MSGPERELCTDLLIDLADNVASLTQKRFKVSKDVSDQFGQEIAAKIADHWGGQNLYVPQDAAGRVRAKYIEIYDEFDGHNHTHLARKHGFSVQHIYRIIRLMRDEHRQKQHSLFSCMD